MARDHHPDALVQTDWLAAHLADPDLRLFECTTWLRPAAPGEGVPYHPEAGRADYEAGHIPGAGFLDLPGELSRRDAPVNFMMLPAAQFAEVMGRHGVGDGARVVLYSRERVMWATRVWASIAPPCSMAASKSGSPKVVRSPASPEPIRTRPSRRARAAVCSSTRAPCCRRWATPASV
jgi:hypothetical protein